MLQIRPFNFAVGNKHVNTNIFLLCTRFISNLPLKILENYRVNVKHSPNSNPSNLFGFRLFVVMTSDCGVAFILNIRQEFHAKITKVV
jgi:hypothetical protein